jgi:hypothetical protein
MMAAGSAPLAVARQGWSIRRASQDGILNTAFAEELHTQLYCISADWRI